jgi:hypothetical protein
MQAFGQAAERRGHVVDLNDQLRFATCPAVRGAVCSRPTPSRPAQTSPGGLDRVLSRAAGRANAVQARHDTAPMGVLFAAVLAGMLLVYPHTARPSPRCRGTWRSRRRGRRAALLWSCEATCPRGNAYRAQVCASCGQRIDRRPGA